MLLRHAHVLLLIMLVLIGIAACVDTVPIDDGSDGDEPIEPAAEYDLTYGSAHGDAPDTLSDATLKGDVYVLLSPDDRIERVTFLLDGDVIDSDGAPPFDLGSGAVTWDTREWTNADHTMTARIELEDGTTIEESATFTVQNSMYRLRYGPAHGTLIGDLDGATITEDLYVAVEPADGIDSVSFVLDDRAPDNDYAPIFDFLSGAVAFDTTTLEDGEHVMLATITLEDGSTEGLRASFSVDNTGEAPTDRTAKLFEPIEYTIQDVNVANPFDVEARAVFTHENGETIRTNLFYVGSGTFAFRFTGTKPGVWTYETTSSVSQLDGTSGSVSVLDEAAGIGFLTHEGNRFAVQTENGLEGYLFNAYMNRHEHPAMLDDITNFEAYLDDAERYGFDVVYVSLYHNVFSLGSDTYEHGRTEPDLAAFDKLDALLDQARARDMRIHFWMWGDASRKAVPEGLAGGANGEADQRLQRYIAARLGPVPGWTMNYGFDLREWADEDQVGTWAGYIDSQGDYDHILFARGRSDDRLGGVSYSWLGYDSSGELSMRPVRTYRYGDARTRIESDRTRPHLFEERFSRNRYSGRYGIDVFDDDTTRQLLWEYAMAGGVGSFWGFYDWEYEQEQPPYPNDEDLRTFNAFWDEHWTLDLDVVSVPEGYGLRDAERTIIYVQGTNDIMLSVPNDATRIFAVDTREDYAEVELDSSGTSTYDLPGTSDWAIVIDASGEAANNDDTNTEDLASDDTNTGSNPVTSPDATEYPDHPYYADVRAFPGAEGFGANSKGARGSDARIEFVTNLDPHGPGSLHDAIESTGPRYIIPLVWGEVNLESAATVTDGRVTYAGQFMPQGEGIVLQRRQSGSAGTGSVLYPRGADDLIFRYLKIYRGYGRYADPDCCGNAVTLYRDDAYGEDIIFDRFSFAFTTDNMIGSRGTGVTWQHGMFLYPLHRANHEKGTHGKGPLIGYSSEDISYHHNFQSTSQDRHPMLSSARGTTDVRNNYNYNTLWGPTFRNDNSGAAAQYNYIGNMLEHGPHSSPPRSYWALFKMKTQYSDNPSYPKVYLEGNENHRISATDDQWQSIDYRSDSYVDTPSSASTYRVSTAFDAPTIRETDAFTARDEILSSGGPSCVRDPNTGTLRNVRDSLIELAVTQAETNTGFSTNVNGYDRVNPFTDIDPDVPNGGISEAEFWNEHFDPWRDANHPGYEWDDFVDSDGDGNEDYQLIEVYLNSWVPDFSSMTEEELALCT